MAPTTSFYYSIFQTTRVTTLPRVLLPPPSPSTRSREREKRRRWNVVGDDTSLAQWRVFDFVTTATAPRTTTTTLRRDNGQNAWRRRRFQTSSDGAKKKVYSIYYANELGFIGLLKHRKKCLLCTWTLFYPITVRVFGTGDIATRGCWLSSPTTSNYDDNAEPNHHEIRSNLRGGREGARTLYALNKYHSTVV